MTSPDDEGWRRLDGRTVLAAGTLALGACLAGGVPTLVGMRSADPVAFTLATAAVVAGTVVLVALTAVVEWVRLRRTHYRVGAERVELHTGVVVRSRRGLARERVRTVEVTADPVLRVLGLATVRIGTGQRAGVGEKPLELRALRRGTAEALRGELLARRPARTADVEAAPRDEVLAVLDPAWVRFAPLSVLTPTVGIAAFGALLQASDWVGLQGTVLDEVVVAAEALGLLVTVVVAVVAVGVVGSVGSLVVFAVSWWRFRLTREPRTGSLHVRRGLLTTRSTTLEEERLRGVAVVEPPGARILGAARVDAIATGLSHAEEERSDPRGLLPVAPLAVAERVVADALREPLAPTAQVALRAHPRAALAPTAALGDRGLPGARRRGRGARHAGGLDGPRGAHRGAGGPRPRGGPPARHDRLPQPRARARGSLPRHPPRRARAPHGGAAPRRHPHLDGHPVALPAPRRPRDAVVHDGGRRRPLRGVRRGRGRGGRPRRRGAR